MVEHYHYNIEFQRYLPPILKLDRSAPRRTPTQSTFVLIPHHQKQDNQKRHACDDDTYNGACAEGGAPSRMIGVGLGLVLSGLLRW